MGSGMKSGSNGVRYFATGGPDDPDDDLSDEDADLAAEDDDPHTEIARLEAHIERFGESLERCRKIRLFSQIAIVGGAIWLTAALVGLIGFDAVAMVVAISAVIGGIVGYGSNTTTARETTLAMKRAEARRAELIAGLKLGVVGNDDN